MPPDEYDQLLDSFAPPRRSKPTASHLDVLNQFAADNNLTVGSTTGGRHNPGSLHYTGNAIDIKGSGAFDNATVQRLSQSAQARGLKLRDERTRPPNQKVWGGPHVHIEYAGTGDEYDSLLDSIGKPTQAEPLSTQGTQEPKQEPLKTPRVDVKLGEGAEMASPDEIKQYQSSKPIEFKVGTADRASASINPVENIYNALSDSTQQPRGLAGLQSRKFETPPSRELGDWVKIPSGAKAPTEDDVIRGYLATLGPEYVALGDKFKSDTGQNILSLRHGENIKQNEDGSYSIRPSRGAVQFLNAYMKSPDEGIAEAERQRREYVQAENKAVQESKSQVERARRATEIEKQSPGYRGLFTAGAPVTQAAGTILGPLGSNLREGAAEMRAVGEQAEQEKPLKSLSTGEQLQYGAGALIPTITKLAATKGFGAAQLPALGVLEGSTPQERLRGGLEGAAMQTALGPIPSQLGESLPSVARKTVAGTTLASIPTAQAIAQGEPVASAVIQNAPFALLPALEGKQSPERPTEIGIEKAPVAGVQGEATANIDQRLADREARVQPTFLRDDQGNPVARVLNPDEAAQGEKIKIRPIHQSDTQARNESGQFVPTPTPTERLNTPLSKEIPQRQTAVNPAQVPVEQAGAITSPLNATTPSPASGASEPQSVSETEATGIPRGQLPSTVSETVNHQGRSYEDVQRAIDARETELEKRGINTVKLYDPKSTVGKGNYERLVKASEFPADWKPMPDDLAALYRERDAIDKGEVEANVKQIDEQFKPLIPDAKTRSKFVRKIAQADLPTALRAEYNPESWRATGEAVDQIMRYISQNVTHDHPYTAFVVKSEIGGTPDNIQQRLRVTQEPGLGPSQATLNETQRWVDHLYGEGTIKIPGAKSVKQLAAQTAQSTPSTEATENALPSRTKFLENKLREMGADSATLENTPNTERLAAINDTREELAKAKAGQAKTPQIKERSFPKTLEETGRLGGTDRVYQVVGDKEAVDKANRRIDSDPKAARDFVLGNEPNPESPRGKERIATGLLLADRLANDAENSTDKVDAATKHAQAIELYSKIGRDLTESGQTVQAASLARKYDPLGAPLEVTRIAQRNGKPPKAEDISFMRDRAKKDADFETRLADLQKQIDEMKAKGKGTPKVAAGTRVKIPTLADRFAQMESEARARLEARKQSVNKGSQAGASAIPLDIADYTIIGAAKIARGGLNFASWSAEMVKEFGDEIKPYLNKIFLESHKQVTEQRGAMKSASEVRSTEKRIRATPKTGETGPYASPETIEQVRQQKYEVQVAKRQNRLDMDRKFKDLEERESKGMVKKSADATGAYLTGSLLSYHGLLNLLETMTAKEVLNTALRIPESMADMAYRGIKRVTGKQVPRASSGVSLKQIGSTAKYVTTEGPRNIGRAFMGKPSEVMPKTIEGPFDNQAANLAIEFMPRHYAAKEAFIRSIAYPVERQNQASIMAHNDVTDGVIKRSELNKRIDDYLNGRASIEGPLNKKYVASLADKAADYEIKSKNPTPMGQIAQGAKAARVKQMIDNPTQLADSLALQYADRESYSNPLGPRMQKMQDVLNAGGAIPRALIQPFFKRPVNAFSDLTYNYSGLRAVREGGQAAFRGLKGIEWTPAERQSFNQAFARGGAVYALPALGAALAAHGLLTSQNDKQHPSSLKIGNSYYAIGNKPVLGWLIAAGATAELDGAKAVPDAIAKMVEEHPLLRGLKNAEDVAGSAVHGFQGLILGEKGKAAQAKKDITSFAGKTLGRLVPTPVAATAETMDTQNRDTRGLTAPLQSRIPFVRQTLPATGQKERFSAFDPNLPMIPLKPRSRGRALRF